VGAPIARQELDAHDLVLGFTELTVPALSAALVYIDVSYFLRAVDQQGAFLVAYNAN
jgi:hypothetical protein